MDLKTILIALILGVMFGFALNKAGLTKYHKIANQFRLDRFHRVEVHDDRPGGNHVGRVSPAGAGHHHFPGYS